MARTNPISAPVLKLWVCSSWSEGGRRVAVAVGAFDVAVESRIEVADVEVEKVEEAEEVGVMACFNQYSL